MPTELGGFVLDSARAVLAEMAHLRQAAAQLARPDGGAGQYRVGGLPGPLVGSLVTCLRDLVATQQVVSRVDASSRALFTLIDQGQLDLALGEEFPGFEHDLPATVDSLTLVEREPIFVALPADHPLADESVVALPDLADDAWLVPPNDASGQTALLRDACVRAGFRPRILHYAADPEAARALLASCNAVCLAYPTSRDGQGVVIRPLVGDPITRRLLIAWRRGGRLSPKVTDLHHTLLRAYQELSRSSRNAA